MLYIIVIYGSRIPDVADRLRENVNVALQESLGLFADQVNISVQGVKILDTPAPLMLN